MTRSAAHKPLSRFGSVLVVAAITGCDPPPSPPPAAATPEPSAVVTAVADTHVRRARYRLKEGRAGDALAELDEALAEAPQHREALALRGSALVRLGETSAAAETVQRAVGLGDASLETRKLLGEALCHAKRFREAEPVYVALLAEHPGDADLAKWHALLLLDLDRSDDALIALERALELAPDDAELSRLLGRQLRRFDSLERGRAVLERAHAADPGDAELAYQLGMIRGDTGDNDGAEAAFRLVLARDAYHVGAINQLIRCAKLAGADAASAELTRRFEVAQRVDSEKQRLREQLQTDGTRDEFLVRLAALEAETGRYEEAASLLRRLVTRQPHNRLAATHLGRLLMRLGRPEEAVGPFERAAMLESDQAEVHLDLAEVQLDLGHGQAANEALAQASERIVAGDEAAIRRLEALRQRAGVAHD